MYNKKNNCWESDKREESEILWCKEAINKNNPQAMFILADDMLGNVQNKNQIAEVVNLMENAAKSGCSRAALAMGQMYQYGCAIGRSKKLALIWYKKAVALGNEEAAEYLSKLKRSKRIQTTSVIAFSVLLVLLGVGLFLFGKDLMPVKGIKVHEDTEVIKPISTQEFAEALSDLVAQYDDDLVISGKKSSNRLLIQFEGEGIDLSSFPADVIIDNGNNYLVVQFASEEEAEHCLEMLKKNNKILFVQEDGYHFKTNDTVTRDDLTSTVVPYTSSYTGKTYYSWGVEYLGLDRLSAWISAQNTKDVTVAVLDTGSEPCKDNANRYLEGIDVVDISNNNGWNDQDGHGTHVAGTIIDCTRGLDVNILPVRVLASGGSSDSIIVLGLQYAIQNNVDVINMSLGGSCLITTPDSSCGSAEDYYIQQAINQGIVVVVAAGNGDDNGNPVPTYSTCPAHMGNCIVVGACDKNDQMAYFSNYGDSVDVCAPGVKVLSYYKGGAFSELSGTSMATPHISALVAMLKMYLPNKTPTQIEKYITDYCVNMGNEQYYGEGIPWAEHFIGE